MPINLPANYVINYDYSLFVSNPQFLSLAFVVSGVVTLGFISAPHNPQKEKKTTLQM